ncbi:MAG: SDR family NAD(P)-dependent oxidoreductase [Actinomycetota bacterium]
MAAVLAQVVLGLALGLYRRRLRYGDSEELMRLAVIILVIAVSLGIAVRSPIGENIRYSVPSLGPAFASLVIVGSRVVWRLMVRRQRESNEPKTSILVVGAGDAGYSAVRLMLDDRRSPYRPVALVDDDLLKSNLRILGVPVLGTIPDLARVVEESAARAVLMAIPSADIDLVRLVDELAREAGVPLLILPPVTKLFSTMTLADMRPVSEADLLGRPTTEIDTDVVAGFIRGRRVLVTGAGGSIGSELCRQLALYEPAALIMLDRDESLLADVQLSLEGRALLDDPNLVLADIRDAERVDEVFDRYQPDVVFHCAALKHLTLLERFPREAWLTNVVGTVNILRAAQRTGVSSFVNVSTDKAADPTSVLGSSKRITERLTAHVAAETGAQYVSVRFGNVLGSRGSVLAIFKRQAELGGPITVTDPGVTRYFMTVQEATRLTAFAGAIGRPGEVLVLDMGAPIRIADVARRFARQSVPDLRVVFTGLRAGEKLHESLFADDEVDLRPVHPHVSHVPAPPLSPADLDGDLGRFEDSVVGAVFVNEVATS